MEYIYAAMLLHKAGKDINEENIKKVLEAAGITPDETRIKSLVAALEGVDIEKAIKEAAVPVASAEQPAKEEKPKEETKEKEEEKVDAAAGLGSLFG